MNATIYSLLYGDYTELHQRLVNSLLPRIPEDVPIILWCNVVCKSTLDWLKAFGSRLSIIDSDENVPKYVAMRRMFHELHPPQTPWLIWFDDDAHIVADNWWPHMLAYIDSKQKENICYIGEPWYAHHLPGQWQFISQSTWFTGRKPQMCPAQGKRRKPGIWFAQGSYWWLRTDIMQKLDWPDPRLKHNGGDTLLGEAIRQQHLLFHRTSYGVKTNDAKRRGHHERPAGSSVNVRR